MTLNDDVMYRNIWDVIEEFGVLQGADALVPVNINRWPAYVLGCAANDEFNTPIDRMKTPFWNLAFSYDSIASAKTQTEYSKRVLTVLQDTPYVNAMLLLL